METLLKLKRDYSKNAVVMFALNEITKLQAENKKLQTINNNLRVNLKRKDAKDNLQEVVILREKINRIKAVNIEAVYNRFYDETLSHLSDENTTVNATLSTLIFISIISTLLHLSPVEIKQLKDQL